MLKVEKLLPADKATAEAVYTLMQASCLEEAKWLKVDTFPPLLRTLTQIQGAASNFYGVYTNSRLVACIEYVVSREQLSIESLVVHPEYFRQGLGLMLVNFLLAKFPDLIFFVSTGSANRPATKLYDKLGFQRLPDTDTAEGIRLAHFSRQTGSGNYH